MLGKKAGTTMVEVIVAVMIVSIAMPMFAKVVRASVQMYSRSLAIIEETEKFNEVYYKKTNIEKRQAVEGSSLTLKEKGSALEIPLPKGELKAFTDPETKIRRYSISVKQE